MRRFLLIALAFGVFSSPAAAADRPWVPTSLTLSVRSAHFVAHFAPGSVDPTRAQAMLDDGERALAMELAWEYPAPLPDDDGLLDVYIYDFGAPWAAGTARTDFVPGMTGLPWKQPGSISVKPTAVVQRGLLAHELFHLIQFRMQEIRGSGFMSEATARWAENGFLGVTQAVWANPQAGLDCLGPTCGSTRTEQGGYDRWTFFAFLSNRYGMRIVREIFEQPVDGPVEAIDRALAAHGSTLSLEFTAFVSADVRSPRDELTTTTSVQKVDLGLRSLSARSVWLTPGRGDSESPCGPATLHLDVFVPEGLTAYYHVLFQPLQQVAGYVDVPWRTCLGQSAEVFFVNSRLRTSTDSGGGYASVAFSITPDAAPAPKLTLLQATVGLARRSVSLLFRSTRECWLELEFDGVKTRSVLNGEGDWARITVSRALKRGDHVLTYTGVSPTGARGPAQRVTLRV